MKKKIAVVTGSRSEYDLLFPVLMELKHSPGFELDLIVTGAHLSRCYGNTLEDIKRDRFRIAGQIKNLLDLNSLLGKAKSAGLLLTALAESLNRLKPDLVIALGDREEPVITGIACNYLNLPFAHIAGGDRTFPEVGDVDEVMRHAATKLAHLHFTMSEEHSRRIIRMGEEPWRVFTVGDPGLDRLKSTPYLNKKELSARLKFDLAGGPVFLVIQHVINKEVDQAARQMRITLQAVAELKGRTLIGYPNSDAGSQKIIEVIEEFRDKYPFIKIYKNLPRLEFVNLLRHTDVLLGNSSMGILECPYLKIPAINIGNRQRERIHADNVLFVDHDKKQIIGAVSKALFDENFRQKLKACKSPYGNGDAAKKIVKILKRVRIDDRLFAKDITY